jgi:hypothetical protein
MKAGPTQNGSERGKLFHLHDLAACEPQQIGGGLRLRGDRKEQHEGDR